MAFHVPNQYRIKSGLYGSDESYGNNGAFFVPSPNSNIRIPTH